MTLAARWPTLFVLVYALVLVWMHTPDGIAVSMDSLSYLSTARNIAEGLGIVYDTHALSGPATTPMTLWPPLYPILLAGVVAIADALGSQPESLLPWLNAALLAFALWLFTHILRPLVEPWLAAMLCVLLALLPSLQIVYMYVWSETLFIPLSLLAYLWLLRYLETPGERSGLLVAATLCLSLATYTRYVGLAYFAAAMLAVLALDGSAWTVRLKRVAGCSALYLLSLAPLFIRNLHYSGHLSGGERGQPGVDLLGDVSSLGWYLYLEILNLPLMLAGVALALALLYIGLLLNRAGPVPEGRRERLTGRSFLLPTLFILCYLAFLLVSRTQQRIDLDTRMLSVIMPFLLLSLLNLYKVLADRVGARGAILPFALLLLASTANAVGVHERIIENWRRLDAPGKLLGIEYLTLSSHHFDILRGIAKHFARAPEDLLLTDIRRPLIAAAFFPQADVRMLPDVPESGSTELAPLLERRGIILLTTTTWSQAWQQVFGGQAKVHTVNDGQTLMLVVELPVR